MTHCGYGRGRYGDGGTGYTVDYCHERIAMLDEQLQMFLGLPSQVSVDGQSTSFAGKAVDLQRERTVWENRLRLALADLKSARAGLGPNSNLQGPDFEMY